MVRKGNICNFPGFALGVEVFYCSKITQNHVGLAVALRVPCSVRRLRRHRTLALLRQCVAEFPQSAAWLGHTGDQSKGCRHMLSVKFEAFLKAKGYS